MVALASFQMRTFLVRQGNCNYLQSLARKTTQNQPVPICLCMQGVPEAMEKRMNLLNFHGNTREWLHPWRNLPKNHPETLGRGRLCQGEAGDGHGQGTPQLLHLQHCILQEEEAASQIGGLKAEKGALEMELALGKECAKLETPQDTRQP